MDTQEGMTRQEAPACVFAEAHQAVAAIVPEDYAAAGTRMIWASLHGLSHFEAMSTLAGGEQSVTDALALCVVEAILQKESPKRKLTITVRLS